MKLSNNIKITLEDMKHLVELAKEIEVGFMKSTYGKVKLPSGTDITLLIEEKKDIIADRTDIVIEISL